MNDIATQYRIIAAGAGWAEKNERGRLRFDGADRSAFLHALLTNEIAALPSGAGTYALYLTPQGRMIADLHLFVRPDCLIADVPAALAASLAETFDRLVFAEDVRIANVSAAMRQLAVVGGGAAEVLARAMGLAGGAVRDLPLWSQLDVEAGFVVRTDDADEGTWDLLVAEHSADAAIAALGTAGAVPVSGELLDAMRIDAGRPQFGVDMSAETIPLEAGLLDRAISQTKGCYVGQEVIIRVLHRGGGRVAKRLVRIVGDEAGEAVPIPGATISADGRDVGHITSAARSPRLGRIVALGYVSRETAETARTVTLSWPGGNLTGAISMDSVEQ